MPSTFYLCLKDKPKLSILKVRHFIKRDWHVTKAVVCSRFSNKRFCDRNFEVCLFVEKDNQINSLHASLKRYKTLSFCLFSKCVIPIIKWSIFLVKCFSHFSNLWGKKKDLNLSFPYKRQLLFVHNINTISCCHSYFQQIPRFRIGWKFSLLCICRVESKNN